MSEQMNIPDGWGRHERPPSLFRRFSFGDYGETSAFLDSLGKLSEETGVYPDISFGKTYANVTIHAHEGNALGQDDADFATHISDLVGVPAA